jgi:hypothetical protein
MDEIMYKTTRSRTRDSEEENRDDHHHENVMEATRTEDREPITSRHSRDSSTLNENDAAAGAEEVPDDESQSNEGSATNPGVRQIFARFKQATDQWTVFRDEELIQELLLSDANEEHDQEDSVSLVKDPSLVSDAINVGGSKGIAAEVSTHISQYDYLGAFGCCLETLMDMGYKVCGSSTEKRDDAPPSYNDQRMFWRNYKSLLDTKERSGETISTAAKQDDVEGSKSKELSSDHNSVGAEPIPKKESVDVPTSETSRRNQFRTTEISFSVAPKESAVAEKSPTETSADQSCDPNIVRVTSQSDDPKQVGAIKHPKNKKRKRKNRVFQRAMFQCYMAWCALRSHVRKSFSRATTTTRGRRRGRPEWVQVPHEDTLDRLVDALEAPHGGDPPPTSRWRALNAVGWGRSSRTRAFGSSPSVVSPMTSHAESSSLGIVMAESRIEI